MLKDLGKSQSGLSHDPQSVFLATNELRTLMLKQRIRMSGIIFWFILLVFSIILLMLLYLIFSARGDVVTRIGLALLDGVIAANLRHIVKFLFPVLVVAEHTNQENGHIT